MSEKTTMFDSTDELGDEFFASYSKSIAEQNANKGTGGGYDAEYDEIAYVGCDRGFYTTVRLLGAPIGAESQGYKRRPHDPKEIQVLEVKDDDGKRFTIRLPLRAETPRDNHILYRIYDKVTEKVKINGESVPKWKTQKPEVYEKVTKGGFLPSDGKTYQFASGYRGDRVSIYNVIDRSDKWCKDNKHSKILCRDLNIDDQNRVWAKPGIKSFGTVTKLAELIGKYGSFEKYDVALQKTGVKENPWNIKNASRLKEAGMTEELINADGSPISEDNIVIGPLTDEERTYERYDLDKYFSPTRYTKIYKRIPSLFKLVDASFGTTFEDEIKAEVEREKKEWEEIRAKQEAEKAAKENKAVAEAVGMTEDEVAETVSPENTPLNEAMESAGVPNSGRRRSAATSDETPAYASLLKGWDKLSDEVKARIVSVSDEGGKVTIKWDRSDDLLQCDTCDAMSPEEVSHCPVCGVKF